MTLSSGDHAIRGLTAESPAGFRMTGDSLRLTETTEPSSVRNFSLLGGRLLFDAGAGLTLVGDASWVGTSIEGPGTTTIAAGSTLTYPGGAGTPIVRNDHVLLNQGTVNWVADEVCVTAGATFDNTATLNITGSGSSMTNCAGGAPVGQLLNRPGATIVHSGTGTTTIAVLFENDGTMRVDGGTLVLVGQNPGTGADTGVIQVAAAATVQLRGIRKFASPARVEGAGTLLISEGARLFGDLVLATNTSWVGGNMEGPGTTTIPLGATLTYPGGIGTPELRNDHVLLNQGTVNWVADEVCVTAGATFDNTATLNITGSGATMTNCAGGAPGGRLRNLAGATIVHTGTGTTTIAVLFENQGTVRVVSGILRVSGSGNYTNPPGATMEFVIGGPTPGTDFGQFQATGTCTLGGTLTVASAPGFTPSPGQSFPVITCGGRTGTFATENSPYPVQYNPTDVTLNAPVGTSAVTLDPPSVAFADQTVGTTSAPRR